MLHKLGANVDGNRGTYFRIWAPALPHLELEVTPDEHETSIERITMQRDEDGVFAWELPPAAGALYRFRLPSGDVRPDPFSRFQPFGVHSWSQVIDPCAYDWSDGGWRGIAKQDLIFYELHLGTFTELGTYAAAMQRLDELVELGINAVELMPMAESAGQWNWGYDGVNFYAPRRTYGTPDELRQFVDAAHRKGLAVILDVVYNHFGPEGNYLRDFGPYISEKHLTRWGDAPNVDDDDPQVARRVRDFISHNATYWIEEFHLDGLRLDAIHCMEDDSQPHIALEVAQQFAQLQSQVERPLHLIAESNVYDPELLRPSTGVGYDAEWCDDFLHSSFAVLRPGEHMSQRVYESRDLEMVLKRGFVFQGGLRGVTRRRIELAHEVQPVELESLVFAIQNHDFIGNHPLGLRLHQLTSDDAHRAAATLLLLYPAIPMLFMGEEFACENPFHFFVDYGDEHLREAVEHGRRAEYPQHDWTAGASPLSPEAFHHSKIGPAHEGNPATLAWYKAVLALRKAWKADGFLQADCMQANWYDSAGLALLQYRKAGQIRFVAVRLHGPDDKPEGLHLQVSGEVDLQQVCVAPDAGRGSDYTLGAFGVLAGEGEVRLTD